MFAYYNHATEDSVPLKSILELVCKNNEPSEISFQIIDTENYRDLLAKSQLAVIHDYRGQFRTILQKKDFATKNGFVAVFVSTAPISSWKPFRQPFFDENGVESTRYLLPIPRTTESGLVPTELNPPVEDELHKISGKWGKLVQVLLDSPTLDAWIRGNPNEMLDGIFSEFPSSVLLPSLAILCQGYLAFQAGFASQEVKKQVAFALEQIGWNQNVMERIHECVSSKDASVGLKLIEQADWWMTSLNLVGSDTDSNTWASFETSLENEFRRNGKADLTNSVEMLISNLKNREVIYPSIVANAYIEIVETLKTDGKNTG